jgi:hypothetical protein
MLVLMGEYSRFSFYAIVAFLENTALWKNRVIETISSIGIKKLGEPEVKIRWVRKHSNSLFSKKKKNK